ncbi:type 2 periplasmic-binding domain-containing protein [Shewanella glacialimarina]|uniref:transporter substrate-binding domain-containing protein n=1 Tax=Shewanella glacialimarina TaxID=2590884 RepID=UPI001CF90E17|nr:transporter substrate-binding domain-containing protein [Shewanella glacialimarina]UCX03682.1 amino acid ABC transporter substrate-binding protein [Shewanella glacialimarina]
MTIGKFLLRGLGHKFIRNCNSVYLSCFAAFFFLMITVLFLLRLTYAANASEGLVADTSVVSDAAVLQVHIPIGKEFAESHVSYFPKLLALALDKTSITDGPYKISYLNEQYTTHRLIAELSKDTHLLSVMWTANSAERQQQLRPVKISILKGLNSYRIFLIRKDDQVKFNLINSLQDLRGFVAGQGAQWPDANVLAANDMPLVTVTQSDSLFPMLASKRFDYFPRGLYEIWAEQPAHANKGLVIEESLLLNYPSPIYFFVNKNDKALADRIERGLTIAISDGSFDELFFSVEGFRKGWAELHSNNRKLLKLKTDFQDQD